MHKRILASCLIAIIALTGCGLTSKDTDKTVNETVVESETYDNKKEEVIDNKETAKTEDVSKEEVENTNEISEKETETETASSENNTDEKIVKQEENSSNDSSNDLEDEPKTEVVEDDVISDEKDTSDTNIDSDNAEEQEANLVYTGDVESCDITKYSTAWLNIRKGPGTEWDKVGAFNVNDEVKVTGACDNGWSRVDYKGEEAYVSSKYLSDKKIEVPKPADITSGNYSDTAKVAAEMASRPGMSGRLYIPGVGLNVAIFNGWSQGVIDAKDSAGTYSYGGGQMMIADHKNQGFSAIKSAVPGQTVAYINNGSTVQAYMCITKGTGQNTATGVPYDLLDCNGNSLYLQNAGGIGMYTCNSHWSSITYTCWQPI